MSYKSILPIAGLILLFGVGAYFLKARPAQETTQPMPEETSMEKLPAQNLKTDITPVTNTVRVVLKTSQGDITLDLEGARAPLTVGNFVTLARDGFYSGTSFHRVIPNFMIQGGDPLSQDQAQRLSHGTGGPDYQFQDEINAESYGLHERTIGEVASSEELAGLPEEVKNLTLKQFYEAQGYQYTTDVDSLPLERGVIAMANSGPNTNGSQFFILVTDEVPHLEGKHTPFGKVVSGMEVIDAIVSVETDEADNPIEPVTINSIEVQQD